MALPGSSRLPVNEIPRVRTLTARYQDAITPDEYSVVMSFVDQGRLSDKRQPFFWSVMRKLEALFTRDAKAEQAERESEAWAQGQARREAQAAQRVRQEQAQREAEAQAQRQVMRDAQAQREAEEDRRLREVGALWARIDAAGLKDELARRYEAEVAAARQRNEKYYGRWRPSFEWESKTKQKLARDLLQERERVIKNGDGEGSPA
jgi:hypothetical protein